MYAELVTRQYRIEAHIDELTVWLRDGLTSFEHLRIVVAALADRQQQLREVRRQMEQYRQGEVVSAVIVADAMQRGMDIMQWRWM